LNIYVPKSNKATQFWIDYRYNYYDIN